MSQESSRKGKSRDTRDRLTFDVGELRHRLRAQAIEPGQSLASIVRMALIEWLEQREAMEDKKSENYQKSEASEKND
jgi:hypothetical protein